MDVTGSGLGTVGRFVTTGVHSMSLSPTLSPCLANRDLVVFTTLTTLGELF